MEEVDKQKAREEKARKAQEKALGLHQAKEQLTEAARQVEDVPTDEVEAPIKPVREKVIRHKKSRRKMPRGICE